MTLLQLQRLSARPAMLRSHAWRASFNKRGWASGAKPFKKVMACNRGEIAVRIMRAANELGCETVAIYSREDRFTQHRYKADQAFLVENKSPVGAYLDIPQIIKIAKENKVEAIHPGYGFLSENPEFAQACKDNGITFCGPTPSNLKDFGDKTTARELALKVGVPCVPGTPGPVNTVEEARAFIDSGVGYPVILKAAHGGGGRGMRVVESAEVLEENFNRATSEAKAAFGNGAVFIERYVYKPRHIEVQILGDGTGNIVHLYDRDCSVQRRHQKVVETAPAMGLDPKTRQAMLNDAVRLTSHAKYLNAGTVEFLVDKEGRYYFIEVNPRIQVEHTVTEVVTGVDLVQSQFRIASGAKLSDLNLTQDNVSVRGVAMQCRVTTEDPSRDFKPDTGTIEVFRSTGGMGIRIPFLLGVLDHPDFVDGTVDTSFIAENPQLLEPMHVANRGSKLLTYISNVIVNGPPKALGAVGAPPSPVDPQIPTLPAPAKKQGPSLRETYVNKGPAAFAKAVRDNKGLLITDTTWRDAHQSLLATRMRTVDMLNIAPRHRHCPGQCLQSGVLGFLNECPWDRLAQLREAVPDIPFQMLLRGANAVGYTSYPDNVVYKFCELAQQTGMDVF
ncbi:pyruvate carboxylase mitochondrial precursor, partial [Tribonema minus]